MKITALSAYFFMFFFCISNQRMCIASQKTNFFVQPLVSVQAFYDPQTGHLYYALSGNSNCPVMNDYLKAYQKTNDLPSSTINIVNHLNQSSEQKTKQLTEQINEQELPLQAPTPFAQEENAPSIFSSLSFKNIIIGAGVSAAVLYLCISFHLKKIEAMLNDPRSWCNWKNEIPADKFFGQKTKDVAKELIHSIQEQYCDVKNPTNTVQPLHCFLKEYSHELALCKRYFSIMHYLSLFKCTRFFKINQEAMELKIKSRIERLIFLRTIFFDWVIENRGTNEQLMETH